LQTEPEKIVPSVQEKAQNNRAKLINFSALAGLIIPFGGVVLPLILTHKTQDTKTKEIGKDIISIQILLAAVLSLFMIISPFIQHLSGTRFPLFLIPLIQLTRCKTVHYYQKRHQFEPKTTIYIKPIFYSLKNLIVIVSSRFVRTLIEIPESCKKYNNENFQENCGDFFSRFSPCFCWRVYLF
jgi:uncharacterized Tic20 family protein